MRYVRAKWHNSQIEMAYRIYISDSLYAISQGKSLAQRYIDVIHPQKEDPRDGNEIAQDVITRLGLKGK